MSSRASCLLRSALLAVLPLACSVSGQVPADPALAAKFDLLPDNLLKNGDFEDGASHYIPHVRPDVEARIVPGGFESASLLSVTVPAGLRQAENFLAQTVRVDPAEPSRSYRVTYWLRHKVLSDDQGGAGVMVSFLDADGQTLGRTADGHLLRVKETLNQWQEIERIKDGNWDSHELSFTLPPGAVAFRVECGLFKAAGNAEFDRIIVTARPTVLEMLAEASPIEAVITSAVAKPHLSEQLFGLNAEFRYAGIYKGTLPESDPDSRRREFAAALHESGVRVLRFPGGMPTHQYFTEGPEALAKLIKAFPGRRAYYGDMWYPRFNDVLDFCLSYGFEMNFQVNTQFFQDADGEIRPITDNRRKAENPALYGENRVPEAKAAFERFVATLPPGAIHYWEIGNEDFSLLSVENYAAIAGAFIPVIKAYNPDAVITVTGNKWTVELCRELAKNGVIDHVDYLSAHYPWGNHWRPEKGGERDLERFICGTLNWAMNTQAHLKLIRSAGFDKIRMSGNETSVFKYHTWNHNVIHTPAHGLLFAANWMEGMKVPDMDNLTFHDLESPFFGMISYDQYFDEKTGRFRIWKKSETPPAGLPEQHIYRDRYVVRPSGHAMKQLSRHAGLNMLATGITAPAAASQRPLFDLLASQDGAHLLVTLVNRGAVARPLTLDVSSWGDRGVVRIGGIRWPELAGLPRPPIESSGNTRVEGGRIEIKIEPYSITQLEVKP
ncbi:hypothetical protein OPIT5_06575 [Opitutaceae bacterium TAV5]|nr:hypothetical protein OPIT5_06575 [Opitutaceae bacterium TAV5]